MSKYHIFTSQTGSLAPASLNVSGTYSYWANASGALQVTLADLSVRNATTIFAQTGTREVVSTGLGRLTTVGNVGTGLFYGTTGLYQYPTFLGEPNYWIPGYGPAGQLISIPAYTRSS
jgi:hypothetical protein